MRWNLHPLPGPPAQPADVARWPAILQQLKSRPHAAARDRVRWALAVDIYLGRLVPQYVHGTLVLDVRYQLPPPRRAPDPAALRFWALLLLEGQAVMQTPEGPHVETVPFGLAEVQQAAGVALALALPAAVKVAV